MRRSSRLAGAGPARSTAATAGAAPRVAAPARQSQSPAGKRRLRRPKKAQPESEDTAAPSSQGHKSPEDSEQLATQKGASSSDAGGSDDGGGGGGGGHRGGGDGVSSSSEDQGSDVSDWSEHVPQGDGSAMVALDFVLWGTGLGRLQVSTPPLMFLPVSRDCKMVWSAFER